MGTAYGYDVVISSAVSAVDGPEMSKGHEPVPGPLDPAQLEQIQHSWGVQLITGTVARRAGDELLLEPSGERLDARRVFAVQRLIGPAIAVAVAVACARAATPRARRCGGRRARSPVSTCLAGWPSTASPQRRRPRRRRRTRASGSARPRAHDRGAEAQYPFDLRGGYRIDDPAIASLGRAMRAIESR